MRTYENKEELKAEIEKTFEKYILEFDNIPENLKDKRADEVDRTPAENLAYQVGWTNLPASRAGRTFSTKCCLRLAI
ncbi:cytoplasmic protein [Streptococcus pneumoniae]|nr:cytoplasmic protein [Streptococcus pneumoniae]